MKISACLITKNEENNIERCINSFSSVVDEIVVVDTGSTDKTVELAEKLGARTYFYNWDNNFSNARNYALDQANGEWVIFLDTDEYFCNDTAKNIPELLSEIDKKNNAVDAVFVHLVNINLINEQVISFFSNIRIFRNVSNIRYSGNIHEIIKKDGKDVQAINVPKNLLCIYHTGYSPEGMQKKAERNLELLRKKLESEDFIEPIVYHYIADCYYALKDYENVIDYEKMFLNSKGNIRGYNSIPYKNCIFAMIQQKKAFEDIKALLEEAMSKFPKHPELYRLQGILYFDNGMYSLSLKSFNYAIELNNVYDDVEPNYFAIDLYNNFYYLGLIYMIKNNDIEAFDYFVKSLKENKYYEDSFEKLTELLQSMPYEDVVLFLKSLYDVSDKNDVEFLVHHLYRFKTPQVILYFTNIWRTNFNEEDSSIIFTLLANGNYDTAYNYFEKCYTEADESQHKWVDKFFVLSAILSNDTEKIINTKNIMNSSSFSNILNAYLNTESEKLTLFDLEDYKKLLKEFIYFADDSSLNKLISLKDNFMKNISFIVGEVLRNNNKYDLAISLYKVALDKREENNSNICFMIGFCYYKIFDFESAVMWFIKSIELGCERKDILEIIQWIQEQNKSTVVQSLIEEFDIKKNEQKNKKFHNNLGIRYYDALENGYKGSIEVSPDNMVDLFYQAEKLYADGKFENAIEIYSAFIYNKKIHDKNIDSISCFRLGEIYNKNRDIEKSVYYHSLALEINPNLSSVINEKSNPFFGYVYSEVDENITTQCPLCGSTSKLHSSYNCLQALDFIPGFNPIKVWMHCEECNHIFTRNYPANLKDILSCSSPEYHINPRLELLPYLSEVLWKIKEISKGNKLLDIGVGAGEITSVATELLYDVTGVEIRDVYAKNVSERLSIPVYNTDFMDFDSKKKFDVICMGDVLEHIPDPVAAMKKIDSLLNNEGVLWLSTPNFESAFSKIIKDKDPMWRVCEHLNYFSYNSIEKLLSKFSLEIIDYKSSRHYNGCMEIIAVKRIENKFINLSSKLNKINLGCGRDIRKDWINIDCVPSEGVDIVANLDNIVAVNLPIKDNSIDEFYASHLVEHINNPLVLMQELHRIAKPNAKAVLRVPYGSSDEAFEDPTHVRQYFLNSFLYFSQPSYWRANYNYFGDWSVEKIVLVVDKEKYCGKNASEIINDLQKERNVVKEMIGYLRAVKPIREPLRELIDHPGIEIKLE